MADFKTVDRRTNPRVVVVGSGLAGLVCARQLARSGCSIDLVTAARAGRDSATARVHALAPWVLLTAPSAKGDSPERYLADIKHRGGGLERPGLAEIFVEASNNARNEICKLLNLDRLDEKPVQLIGDEHPRGWRCAPRDPHDLLGPVIGECVGAGVRIRDAMLVVGLIQSTDRVVGVVVYDCRNDQLTRVGADAVVLACGGTGRVFAMSTSPQWNRGTAIALSRRAGVLLHQPALVQLLPVEASPPHHFPGTATLLRLPVVADGLMLGTFNNLNELSKVMAQALSQGRQTELVLDPTLLDGLPEEMKARYSRQRQTLLPITLAVHHGIGGVAIDTWGRTSMTGLYACGEAAGGIQGQERTMGTGLIEAHIFATRAATAIIHDWPQLGPAAGSDRDSTVAPLADGRLLHHHLDSVLQPCFLHSQNSKVRDDLLKLSPTPLDLMDKPQRENWSAALRLEAAKELLGMK